MKRTASEDDDTPQYPSKRAEKLSTMGNPGKDEKEKGKVMTDALGHLRLVYPNGDKQMAVYHNDIRQSLLDRARHHGTLRYSHERAKGRLAWDETAYHPEQKDWNDNRQNSNIRDNILNHLERRDYVCRDSLQNMQEWFEGDCIVLDEDNHPVIKFLDANGNDVLPLTISSQIEGWWLEAIGRLDDRIQRKDIMARLPREYAKGEEKPQPIFTLPALGNRRDRYRAKEGLIAWDKRTGSGQLETFLKNRLPQSARANNTTQGIPPLTPTALAQLRDLNKGRYPQKANGRNVSEEVRAKRNRRSRPSLRTRGGLRPGLDVAASQGQQGTSSFNAGPSGFGQDVFGYNPQPEGNGANNAGVPNIPPNYSAYAPTQPPNTATTLPSDFYPYAPTAPPNYAPPIPPNPFQTQSSQQHGGFGGQGSSFRQFDSPQTQHHSGHEHQNESQRPLSQSELSAIARIGDTGPRLRPGAQQLRQQARAFAEAHRTMQRFADSNLEDGDTEAEEVSEDSD